MKLLLVLAGVTGLLCAGRAMDRKSRARRRHNVVREVDRWEGEGGATPVGAATQSAPTG